MTTLGHIADVCMGVTLRGRDATRPAPHGSCFMIRISDLSNDGHLTPDELLQFEPGDDIKPDYFLRRGDIPLTEVAILIATETDIAPGQGAAPGVGR